MKKLRRVCPSGCDGASYVPLGYNPKAETAPESYEWWLSQVMLENAEAVLPKTRAVNTAIQKFKQRLLYIEKLWRGG